MKMFVLCEVCLTKQLRVKVRTVFIIFCVYYGDFVPKLSGRWLVHKQTPFETVYYLTSFSR